jgi:hypothetical protein
MNSLTLEILARVVVIIIISPRGGWLEYFGRSPARRRRRRKGNPVPGELKYRDLVLQAGGLTQG